MVRAAVRVLRATRDIFYEDNGATGQCGRKWICDLKRRQNEMTNAYVIKNHVTCEVTRRGRRLGQATQGAQSHSFRIPSLWFLAHSRRLPVYLRC